MDKKRKIIAGALFFIMILIGVLTLFNYDKMFKQTTTLTYFDGCKEEYMGEQLVSGNCSMQKKMLEEQSNARFLNERDFINRFNKNASS